MILYNPAPFLPTFASMHDWTLLGWPAGTVARVRDILAHKELGNLTSYSRPLLAHESTMVRVWKQ